MDNYFTREISLIGKENFEKLKSARVLIFGLGGVGSYAVEGLARAGISNFLLVDNDVYSESNLNNQLYATTKTIGVKKTVVSKERILEINASAKVDVLDLFVLDDIEK
jgi:tRNA A37 threonylcarbamoyladenosine dehydratase